MLLDKLSKVLRYNVKTLFKFSKYEFWSTEIIVWILDPHELKPVPRKEKTVFIYSKNVVGLELHVCLPNLSRVGYMCICMYEVRPEC